jgi:phage gp45-like
MRYAEIRDLVIQSIAWLAHYSKVATSSADGQSDEIEGRSEPDEPSYQVPVRRMGPFGIRSRPPAGVEAFVIYLGGGATRGVMLGAESAKYGPSDLAEGEVAIYCIKAGTALKLDKDGAITATGQGASQIQIDKNGKVTVTAAVGQDIILNGGTLKVARVTDPLKGTAGPYPIVGVVDPVGGAATVKG